MHITQHYTILFNIPQDDAVCLHSLLDTLGPLGAKHTHKIPQISARQIYLWYNAYMATFSFDIVSEYDKAEMNNVFGQAEQEIGNRYDFKGTPAQIEWLNSEKTGVKVTGNGEWQVDAILDIVRKKLATRGQSQKVLDTSKEAVISNLKTSKEVPFKQGLDQDKAKQITKQLRESFPKVKTQIQGDAVRVMSTSKNDLQAVMQFLNGQDFDFPLSFTNYR